MLSSTEYIRKSLALHLFFLRIMKEHSFFLQISFTPKDIVFIQQADGFRKSFDALLTDVVSISNGVVSPEVLKSGEVFTQYTAKAEAATTFYTGVNIPVALTHSEAALEGSGYIQPNPAFEQWVDLINNRAISLVSSLIQFKTTILSNVTSCNMFTNNYPLLLDHILREAKLYLLMVQRLQSREDLSLDKQAYEQEAFWNRIMAEHAKFIRGLLDPTENALISKANDFGNEFDKLTAEALAAHDATSTLKKVTNESLKATSEIRDFKSKGTQGILECNVKSIIIPLLADHTLREANHFLRLLKMFENI